MVREGWRQVSLPSSSSQPPRRWCQVGIVLTILKGRPDRSDIVDVHGLWRGLVMRYRRVEG